MSRPPHLWVFAGPNGAGKSSLVARYRVRRRIPIVNPDEIAAELSPHGRDDPKIVLRAGRIAAEQRREFLLVSQSFAFETTLSGHSEIRVLHDAREAGFKVNVVYVGLDDDLVSLTRVRARVLKGGHDVPVDAVMRRYGRSLANLPEAVRLSHRCFLLDNSQRRHRLLGAFEDGRVRWAARTVPGWAQGVLGGRPSGDA